MGFEEVGIEDMGFEGIGIEGITDGVRKSRY
jgi:hypothetical protein